MLLACLFKSNNRTIVDIRLFVYCNSELGTRNSEQRSAALALGPLNQASMPIIAGQIDEQITSLTSLTPDEWAGRTDAFIVADLGLSEI